MNIKPLNLRKTMGYAILLMYTLLALFPIGLVLINSFKVKVAIFNTPLAFPQKDTFSLEGYKTVFIRSDYPAYIGNSLTVTLVTLFLILLLGAMTAWALSEYKFKGNSFLKLYMTLGIMIPIRLGTIVILKMGIASNLTDTLLILILVYTAQGLPLTILVLQQFISQIPKGLKDAARIDGASEYYIFIIILPMIAPAVATVAVFTMIPIWNDLWFPLILAPQKPTLILGIQQFLGQYVTDWSAVISALVLAIIPIITIYIIFSKQMVSGITEGAVKG